MISNAKKQKPSDIPILEILSYFCLMIIPTIKNIREYYYLLFIYLLFERVWETRGEAEEEGKRILSRFHTQQGSISQPTQIMTWVEIELDA